MSFLFKIIVISIPLSVLHLSSASANQCKQRALKIKQEQATKRSNMVGAMTMNMGRSRGQGIHDGGQDTMANGNAMKNMGASAADGCHKALKQCQSDCSKEGNVEELCAEFKECRAQGVGLMNEGANTSQQGSNTMGAAGAGIMGAALGALGAMMMNKKKKDKKKKEEGTEPASEDSDDGGSDVACADRTGGFADADCADHFVETCFNDQTAPNCGDFKNHYCPSSGSTGSDAKMAQGNGSQYCNLVTSLEYCEDSANRFSPSCLWIASRGIVCETNPSSSECFPQYTNAELEQACQGLSTDPLCNGLLGFDASGDSMVADNENSGEEGDTSSGEGSSSASSDPREGSNSSASIGASVTSTSASTQFISVWHSTAKLHEDECRKGELLECRKVDVPDYIRQIENDVKNGYM